MCASSEVLDCDEQDGTHAGREVVLIISTQPFGSCIDSMASRVREGSYDIDIRVQDIFTFILSCAMNVSFLVVFLYCTCTCTGMLTD